MEKLLVHKLKLHQPIRFYLTYRLVTKLSSSLVLDTISVLMYLWIPLAKASNLFLMELILIWAILMLRVLFK